MSLRIEAMVGPQVLAKGSRHELTLDRTAALRVSMAHGKYFDAVYNGNVFVVSNGVAGVSHGTALETSPPLVLQNLPGTGKLLSILRTAIGYVSGTLGAGFIAYARAIEQYDAIGSALVPVNCKFSNKNAAGRAASEPTLDTSASDTLLRAAYNVNAVLATSATQPPTSCSDDVDGEFLIPETEAFAIQGICGAGGTSPLVANAITWEEIDVAQ